MRKGIKPGEACHREVAAYLLDHKGFSSVPMTTLAEARSHAFNVNGSQLNLGQGGASLGNHALSGHLVGMKASASTPNLLLAASISDNSSNFSNSPASRQPHSARVQQEREIPMKVGSLQQVRFEI